MLSVGTKKIFSLLFRHHYFTTYPKDVGLAIGCIGSECNRAVDAVRAGMYPPAYFYLAGIANSYRCFWIINNAGAAAGTYIRQQQGLVALIVNSESQVATRNIVRQDFPKIMNFAVNGDNGAFLLLPN